MADEPVVSVVLGGLFPEPEFAIYKIVHRASGRGYIGLTSQSVPVRYRRHWSASKREDSVLYRAFRKYGRKAFYVITLAVARSSDDLPELEQKLIADHSTFVDDGGFNMTRGGEGSPEICDEVRQNMRRAAAARMADPDLRARIAATLKGRKCSPEHIAASAAGRRGRPLSDAHKAKLAVAMKKRPPPTEEQRRKISVALSGRKLSQERIELTASALRGRKRDPMVVAKIAAANNMPAARAKRSASLRAWHARRREVDNVL